MVGVDIVRNVGVVRYLLIEIWMHWRQWRLGIMMV